MEDKQLAEYLRQYHLGEGSAATSRELERTFSVRGKELRDPQGVDQLLMPVPDAAVQVGEEAVEVVVDLEIPGV